MGFRVRRAEAACPPFSAEQIAARRVAAASAEHGRPVRRSGSVYRRPSAEWEPENLNIVYRLSGARAEMTFVHGCYEPAHRVIGRSPYAAAQAASVRAGLRVSAERPVQSSRPTGRYRRMPSCTPARLGPPLRQ